MARRKRGILHEVRLGHEGWAKAASIAAGSTSVRAMATASRLFSMGGDTPSLLAAAASELAVEPGQVCLVSRVVPRTEAPSLQPFGIAHARPDASRKLRGLLHQPREQVPVDAFSQEVLRSGGALRMDIGDPKLLRLWLPEAYWPYVEQAGVCSVLATALVQQGRVLGTFLLWRERGQPSFGEGNQAYVSQLASRLALAINPTD